MPLWQTVLVVITCLATPAFVICAALVVAARGKADYQRYLEIQQRLTQRKPQC